MTRAITLPDPVAEAIASGVSAVRAYREHLGYSAEELAIACGLTVEEITNIEAGHRYEKRYRERIARVLSLPDDILSEPTDVPNAA